MKQLHAAILSRKQLHLLHTLHT